VNILYLKRCWVCGETFETTKAGSRCCRWPECRAAVWEIDTILLLRFLLEQSRWTGGPGWADGELAPVMYPMVDGLMKKMREAVKRLESGDEGPLAELLIELCE
jgi:hypothetical protein